MGLETLLADFIGGGPRNGQAWAVVKDAQKVYFGDGVYNYRYNIDGVPVFVWEPYTDFGDEDLD